VDAPEFEIVATADGSTTGVTVRREVDHFTPRDRLQDPVTQILNMTGMLETLPFEGARG